MPPPVRPRKTIPRPGAISSWRRRRGGSLRPARRAPCCGRWRRRRPRRGSRRRERGGLVSWGENAGGTRSPAGEDTRARRKNHQFPAGSRGPCGSGGRAPSLAAVRNGFYQGFDTERLSGRGDREDFRSTFQIDRDRILHTPAFRRLQAKTQVFWSGEYDFYRTRLTHSLEVAQIGRSICGWLQASSEALTPEFFIDPDLVEAVCLSHDLGHPPFGHAGERSLNHFMIPYGGFEGNAQTLRLLTERIFSQKRTGMDPSRAFLDGVLKYKSLWSEVRTAGGSPPENHFVYDAQERYVDWVLAGNDFPAELPPGDGRDGFKSVECQVMDWADDTAYSLNDLADSVRAGFLTIQKIEGWAEKAGEPCGEGTPLGDLLRAIRRGRVDAFAGRRIGDYIKAASLAEDVNFLSSATNRYRYKVAVAPEVRAESAVFKRMAFEVVFLSPALKQLEHKGNFMLRRLWDTLHTRYVQDEAIDGQRFQLLPGDAVEEIESASSGPEKARLVCDFLAGMTDGYAARMYRRLFVPGSGSIGDLVG
ncbi:MAG: dNTP triphosphohydrolase [Akkermansiaceae bacterium]|nr:dNTP triphosphohydrolase [Akkermansiaceae bacterium]NNM30773.1 dNTP triphosphohydrolase [Akkermansiaceae bacterium]